MKEFRLAPMSPLIRGLTIGMLFLPVAFFVGALTIRMGRLGIPMLVAPGTALVAVYAWIWLGFRPSRFVVTRDAIEVTWPLKRRTIARSTIVSAEIVDVAGLRERAGRGLRVGAGGVWGGFGWLWTSKRGIVQMYVSRTDGLVWIERGTERPWLITPENPEGFVSALRG